MVGGIVVVAVLTHCELLLLVYDLKVTQINVEHSLIWEFMLCNFELCYNAAETTETIYESELSHDAAEATKIIYGAELGHNTAEATKNICYVKGEAAIDHYINQRTFTWTSIIRQGQVSLKAWIPRLCSKP